MGRLLPEVGQWSELRIREGRLCRTPGRNPHAFGPVIEKPQRGGFFFFFTDFAIGTLWRPLRFCFRPITVRYFFFFLWSNDTFLAVDRRALRELRYSPTRR